MDIIKDHECAKRMLKSNFFTENRDFFLFGLFKLMINVLRYSEVSGEVLLQI